MYKSKATDKSGLLMCTCEYLSVLAGQCKDLRDLNL